MHGCWCARARLASELDSAQIHRIRRCVRPALRGHRVPASLFHLHIACRVRIPRERRGICGSCNPAISASLRYHVLMFSRCRISASLRLCVPVCVPAVMRYCDPAHLRACVSACLRESKLALPLRYAAVSLRSCDSAALSRSVAASPRPLCPQRCLHSRMSPRSSQSPPSSRLGVPAVLAAPGLSALRVL